MGDRASRAACQAAAEHKQQRRSQHEPGQNAQEGLRGRVQQKVGAGNCSDHAGDGERNHDAARKVEVPAISAGAGRHSLPERYGISGIRRDGSHSAEQQSGEGDEAATAGDRVKRAAESAREK